ncbi:MAG: DUF3014 domain-containing protein [Gammaproteobacteria bacterium]|nr:DUF3014 domain-containing protein [Gammaproteobacteria bacterium]
MTERFDPGSDRPRVGRALPILAVVLGLGIGAYFLFLRPPTQLTVPAAETPLPTPAPAAPTTTEALPATPSAGTTAAPAPTRIPAVPTLQATLPELADSDVEVREHLRALLGDGPLAAWFKQDSLLQRIAVLIAGLARGEFSLETLLLAPPAGGFQVDIRDGKTYVSPRNYARYNTMVGLVDGLDVTALAEFFQRYRPLLEAAYGELGQPPEQLDAALLGAIDLLLETPELATPPALAQESVAYTYADPALEGLSEARKQLLRMGPEHTRTLKVKLNALRTALLVSPPDPATNPAAEQHALPPD